MITYDKLFIGGWATPASNERIDVTSASTEEPIGSVPAATEADVDAAVAAARSAFDDPQGWANWEPARRADALDQLADKLEAKGEEMARRVSAQNGMPITISSQLEAGFPLVLLRYYANLLRGFDFEVEQDHVMGGKTYVRREPVGVVGAIAPWNYPQALAAFKHAPALAAGCAIVLKPSPETVLDAFLFAEAVAETDIPQGVVNIVPGGREIRCLPGCPPRHRQGGLHRLDGSGQADRNHLRTDASPRHARTRWEVGGHRARRRESRPVGDGGAAL